MEKSEFLKELNNYKNIDVKDESETIISVCNDIDTESLLKLADLIYTYEQDLDNVNVKFLLKGLETNKLIEIFKYSLSREDLKDPVMILNILDLSKIYNTLDDSFFSNEYIYLNSIEDIIDVKLSLKQEIEEFRKKISIYFLSLFKSFNKMTYTPMDKHIKLPNVFEKIFLSSDVLTLSGIFSASPTFSTEELVYVDDALFYITSLLSKNILAMGMLNNFLENKYQSEGEHDDDSTK